MKHKLLLSCLLILLMLSSCVKDYLHDPSDIIDYLNGHKDHLKIAVVSDLHYMDPSLLKNGAEGSATFQNYLSRDPKLIVNSDPILKEVISELKSEKPDIVLIPGDLTKDGELISHQSVVALLRQLQHMHIKIYVVPGNHDINNPEAVAYNGNSVSPVPSISATDFSTIYSGFGYGNAISRDPNSLSYVSELYPNVWILAIDANEYYDNTDKAIVAGKIKPETMQWIQNWLAEAKQKNITVLGLMHHNILEHYSGQNQLDPGYVIDNWEASANALMNAGLRVIFTGHNHANDVTKRINNGQELYDVETGSLVTPPSPYRIVILKNKELDISTNRVQSIPAALPNGLSFPAYSNMFLTTYLDGYFSYALSQPPFSLADPVAAAPLFRNAIMAYYAGDEKISPQEQTKDNALTQISPLAGMALTALWNDLAPKDNKLHIKLSNP